MPAIASDGPNRLVELGRIVSRHGVRGEVRVLPHNPDSTLLRSRASLWIRGTDSVLVERRVRAARPHKRFVLLQLEGIEDAAAADALIGGRVCVPRPELPPLAAGEYYHADLVGCLVRTDTGRAVGRVREVMSTASNDVCVVGDERGESLVPLIDSVIVRIDLEAREIVVRALPGLLDP